MNGEAIYGTHNWTTFGIGGGRGDQGPHVRFTVKGDTLYAIVVGDRQDREVAIAPLARGPALEGRIASVTLLGDTSGQLEFIHDRTGLKVKLPAATPCRYACTLKISGLKMNPPTATRDGNPRL